MNQEKRQGPGINVFVLLLLILVAVAIAWDRSVEDVTLPLNWPVAAPSQAQVQQARDCNITELFIERYPLTVDISDLPDAYAAQTGCDWAALAIAYAVRVNPGEPPALAGQEALAKATFLNSAYALTTPLLSAYFGLPVFVEAPPLTQQPLTQVRLRYSWNGMGGTIEYDVAISGEDESVASGTINGAPYEASLPEDMVQELGASLTNLIPIGEPLALVVCLDNYPDWYVTLTFADGTELELVTHGSNAISVGGPWQVTIDGQNYLQYSPTFLLALADIITTLNLPYGPPAENCSGLEQSLLDLTYP